MATDDSILGEEENLSIGTEDEQVGAEQALDSLNPFVESNYQSLKSKGVFALSSPPELEWTGMGRIKQFDPFSLPMSSYKWKNKIQKAICEKDILNNRVCKELLEMIATHKDILYLEETCDNHERLLIPLAAHSLNLILSARDTVVRNNARLSIDRTLEVRDHGLTRPRILFLCPMRNTAWRFVKILMGIWESDRSAQIEQRRRFQEEYQLAIDSDGEPIEQENLGDKPPDYQHVFAGNIDDCFRIGVKVTRKALKLYSDFYSADILIASPLGLKLILEGREGAKTHNPDDANGNRKRNVREGKPDSDFLSSIELLAIDQVDVMAQQNFDHLITVLSCINQIPKEAHGCDFSRLLSVFLDNQQSSARQNIIMSAFAFPALMNAFNSHCKNALGAIRVEPDVHSPSMQLSSVRPEFHFIPCVDPIQEAELRIQHFTDSLVPKLLNSSHVLIHVASYFEWSKLHQILASKALSFTAVSEYSDDKEVTRARSRFYNGHIKILLLTERFHFYHRFNIKGVKRIVFYSLPEYHRFFREWTAMVKVREGVKCAPIVMVSPLDRNKVVRIFGSKAGERILQSIQ